MAEPVECAECRNTEQKIGLLLIGINGAGVGMNGFTPNSASVRVVPAIQATGSKQRTEVKEAALPLCVAGSLA